MKHRTLIEMLAFFTVAIFLCFYFSFSVLGAVNFDVKSNFDVKPVFSSSDFEEDFLPHQNSLDSASDFYNNSDWLISDNISNFFYDSTLYVWNQLGFYPCTDDSFLVVSDYARGSSLYLCIDELDNEHALDYSYLITDFNNYSLSSTSMRINSTTMVDGKRYKIIGGASAGLLSSNIPIYYKEGYNFNTNIGTLEGLEQINPNYNGNDDSSNIRDHRNFNPAFMFISTNTNYGGDGLVTSLGYDKWQKSNLDRFKITWNYSLDFTVASTSDSHTAHFVKNGYSQTLDYIPSGRFAMSLPEIFCTMYDGNTNCWNTIKDISMKTIKNDSSFGVSGGVNIGVANFQLSTNTPLSLAHAIGITEFKFYVTASIVTDDNLDCGTFDYSYDFLNGTYTNNSTFKNQDEVNNTISQYNHDNNLSSGDSGYLDITDYQSNLPASNNYPAVSGGSVSQGGSASAQGGVAYGSNVNNSVIVNTGQDAKEVIKYAKNELLPANYEGGYVEKLETVTDSNNFIQYMSTTFTFIPQTFWNDVAYYGKIALIILVSGFILSLVRRLIN